MTTVNVTAHSIRNGLAAARKHLGKPRREFRVLEVYPHGDGLYRAEVEGGVVVEIAAVPHSLSVVNFTY